MKRNALGLALVGLLACSSSDKDNQDTVTDDTTSSRDGGRPSVDSGRRDGSSSNNNGGSTNRDTGIATCESQNVNAAAHPPDILIVLDKSLSMLAARWMPSSNAVKQLTTEFDNTASFGLMTFPNGALSTCNAGQIDVPVAPMNAMAISNAINATVPFGLTPTADSLKAAAAALGDRKTPVADTLPTPTYVVLVTDGEPNCPSLTSPDPAGDSVAAVAELANNGIKTYVIGYEVAQNAGLMNQLAQAGSTDHYYEVANQQQLSDAFHEITKTIVKCDFELDREPTDPTYVRVTIDGETVPYNTADGWVIDGKKVTLQAASCDKLRDGSAHALSVQVECAPVLYQ